MTDSSSLALARWVLCHVDPGPYCGSFLPGRIHHIIWSLVAKGKERLRLAEASNGCAFDTRQATVVPRHFGSQRGGKNLNGFLLMNNRGTSSGKALQFKFESNGSAKGCLYQHLKSIRYSGSLTVIWTGSEGCRPFLWGSTGTHSQPLLLFASKQ